MILIANSCSQFIDGQTRDPIYKKSQNTTIELSLLWSDLTPVTPLQCLLLAMPFYDCFRNDDKVPRLQYVVIQCELCDIGNYANGRCRYYHDEILAIRVACYDGAPVYKNKLKQILFEIWDESTISAVTCGHLNVHSKIEYHISSSVTRFCMSMTYTWFIKIVRKF